MILADYNARAGEDAVRATRGLLGPQLSLVGDLNRQIETVANGHETTQASVTARLTMPLYEAGSVYAQTRAAKQTLSQLRDLFADARNAAVQSAARDWEQIRALRQRAASLNSTIRAAEIALEGVRQEAQVGSRTVLDVLNAEQELLTDRVNLAAAEHDLAVIEFDLAQQIGRLTAAQLKLPVELYDPNRHYREVRGKWIGFGPKE